MSGTPIRRLSLTLAAAALVSAACGAEDPSQTPGREVVGGNAGVDTPVSDDVLVEDVELEYPLDGVYDEGEDASLYVAVVNEGRSPVTLVDISGPAFARARSSAEPDGDVQLRVEPGSTLFIGAEGAPSVTLTDLATELHSSESIPVTFTFESAGQVTVDAMVAAEGQTPGPTADFPVPDNS